MQTCMIRRANHKLHPHSHISNYYYNYRYSSRTCGLRSKLSISEAAASGSNIEEAYYFCHRSCVADASLAVGASRRTRKLEAYTHLSNSSDTYRPATHLSSQQRQQNLNAEGNLKLDRS